MSALALPRSVADIIDEFNEKTEGLDVTISAFRAAIGALQTGLCVGGTFGDYSVRADVPHVQAAKKSLLMSGWRAVYNRLGIADIATAKDKALFERTLADPPPLTLDTARATFSKYLENPRFHILRGLAEAFCSLDQSYKSHSKVRIGVSGLPKRIILSGWGASYNQYTRGQFADMINALAAFQGKESLSHDEISAIGAAHQMGEDAHLNGVSVFERRNRGGNHLTEWRTVDRGVSVRKFSNGNAHVIFTPATLLDINRALAEFYGEVLPDVEEENATRRASTEVSADLQFYWSPPDVVNAACDFADIKETGLKVLEPSCGDGRILDLIQRRGCRGFGFEVDRARAMTCARNGHSVICANFLTQPATPTFDRVVMNPPFYGRHYLKHVTHALGFLKPGGQLVAILPATARYDHGDLNALDGEWRDLPVASFAEAGTNVPTVLWRKWVQ